METTITVTSRPQWFIAYGNFLFKHRNAVFPLFVLPLFLSLAPVFSSQWIPWTGIILAVLGQLIRMAVIGFAYIKRGGLNKKVYAESLVTTGFFALCRNPLYVGNVLILAGLLIMHGHPVVLIVGGIFFLTAYQAIIAAEETYLDAKFGDEYAQYCACVPRWLLRLDRMQALRGMSFNWRKVIYKDYSTFASWGAQALVIFAYRAYSETGELSMIWPICLLALIVVTLTIRLVKKKFPL